MDKIYNIVLHSLLFELNINPKPGLVTPFSNGSHKDLDYQKMFDSSIFLSTKLSQVGSKLKDDLSFKQLQSIGLQIENEMLNAFKTNTHKGFLFMALIVINSYYVANSYKEFINRCQQFGKQSLIDMDDQNVTNGITQIKKYKLKGGIRNTIATMELFKEKDMVINSPRNILTIFACIEDTCVINRVGLDSYLELKNMAIETLNNLTKENYQSFLNKFKELNASAGGLADVLAIQKLIQLLFNNITHQDILEAKERRMNWLKNSSLNKVFIKFNTPGIVKQNKHHLKILLFIMNKYLVNKVNIVNYVFISDFAGEGLLIYTKDEAISLKERMIELENLNQSFRVLDVDVYDNLNRQISRTAIGSEARKCFICDDYAKHCVRSKKHDFTELYNYYEQAINEIIKIMGG